VQGKLSMKKKGEKSAGTKRNVLLMFCQCRGGGCQKGKERFPPAGVGKGEAPLNLKEDSLHTRLKGGKDLTGWGGGWGGGERKGPPA